jgi:cellobiose phosphorylase
MISGKEAQIIGEARNSWLTGTAAWNYVAITQHILGIRATYDGLQIAPVIPTTWSGFEAVRKYRNVDYQIKVERLGTGNDVTLSVDGKAITGTVIPLPADGTKEVKVFVTIK